MKTGIAAALILLGVPAAGIAQRAPAQPADRDLPGPISPPVEAEPRYDPPRTPSPGSNQAGSDDRSAPRRSPYGNGIQVPWQNNPIRTPWQ
jgi:hypothetical protein